jgi:hypothetical protein
MADGYIYCLTHPSMPGILKVGMTERTPEDRVKELFTTSLPFPFNIEFAKRIKDPKMTEAKIHNILENVSERINSRREFFRVSPSIVRMLFDLVDGEMWVTPDKEIIDNDNSIDNSNSNNINNIEVQKYNTTSHKNKQFVIKKSRSKQEYIVSKAKKSKLITQQCVKYNLSEIRDTLSEIKLPEYVADVNTKPPSLLIQNILDNISKN